MALRPPFPYIRFAHYYLVSSLYRLSLPPPRNRRRNCTNVFVVRVPVLTALCLPLNPFSTEKMAGTLRSCTFPRINLKKGNWNSSCYCHFIFPRRRTNKRSWTILQNRVRNGLKLATLQLHVTALRRLRNREIESIDGREKEKGEQEILRIIIPMIK